MRMRAYDVHDQVSNAWLVIAPSRREALRLAIEHQQSFSFPRTRGLTAIERLPALAGRSRDQLLAALQAGAPGIAHRQVSGGWWVHPPGISGGASAQAALTKAFHYVDDEGDEMVLFAHGDVRANELYDGVITCPGAMPRAGAMSAWTAWNTVGLVRHLAQAERRGIEGIGLYRREGWQILPINYVAIGMDPPDP